MAALALSPTSIYIFRRTSFMKIAISLPQIITYGSRGLHPLNLLGRFYVERQRNEDINLIRLLLYAFSDEDINLTRLLLGECLPWRNIGPSDLKPPVTSGAGHPLAHGSPEPLLALQITGG